MLWTAAVEPIQLQLKSREPPVGVERQARAARAESKVGVDPSVGIEAVDLRDALGDAQRTVEVATNERGVPTVGGGAGKQVEGLAREVWLVGIRTIDEPGSLVGLDLHDRDAGAGRRRGAQTCDQLLVTNLVGHCGNGDGQDDGQARAHGRGAPLWLCERVE